MREMEWDGKLNNWTIPLRIRNTYFPLVCSHIHPSRCQFACGAQSTKNIHIWPFTPKHGKWFHVGAIFFPYRCAEISVYLLKGLRWLIKQTQQANVKAQQSRTPLLFTLNLTLSQACTRKHLSRITLLVPIFGFLCLTYVTDSWLTISIQLVWMALKQSGTWRP